MYVVVANAYYGLFNFPGLSLLWQWWQVHLWGKGIYAVDSVTPNVRCLTLGISSEPQLGPDMAHIHKD